MISRAQRQQRHPLPPLPSSCRASLVDRATIDSSRSPGADNGLPLNPSPPVGSQWDRPDPASTSSEARPAVVGSMLLVGAAAPCRCCLLLCPVLSQDILPAPRRWPCALANSRSRCVACVARQPPALETRDARRTVPGRRERVAGSTGPAPRGGARVPKLDAVARSSFSSAVGVAFADVEGSRAVPLGEACCRQKRAVLHEGLRPQLPCLQLSGSHAAASCICRRVCEEQLRAA